MLLQRKPYEIDMEAVMRAARDHGKMLELNAHPARLDLDDVACAAAKGYGHSDRHFDRLASARGPGRDALRRAAGPPRRSDEGRRGQHPTWPQMKKMLGKEVAVSGCTEGEAAENIGTWLMPAGAQTASPSDRACPKQWDWR